MAYEKTTWQSGDVVTSEKLNNIENGIASLDYVILEPTVDIETGYLYLGKSYNELLAYYNGNKIVIAKWQFSNDGGGEVTAYQEYDITILNKLTNDEQFGYGAYFGERGFFSNTADGELYAD